TAAPYAFTWSNVGAGTYTLSARAVYDAGSIASSAPVSVAVTAPPSSSGLSFASTSGAISAPFTAANGMVYQTSNTGVASGGRAVYNFNIANAGSYVVSMVANAPNDSANSLYVNIDGEPADPTMIWDVPIAATSAASVVSWRGTGTFDRNQFAPKAFTLSAGAHQLVVRGREPNCQFGTITIVPFNTATKTLANSATAPVADASTTPTTTLAAPWQSLAIGRSSATGSASASVGASTVSGSGDLSGAADAFQFVYQSLSGDGEI